jgi:asparagine synthase (glutamine-hydrolysing)
MCGIAGIWGPGDLSPMVAIMRHRGPDEDGFFPSRTATAKDSPFRMGMRRLNVIDLKTGSQPIYNEDRTIAVVYNGEIYNFHELRRDLEKRGHRFSTRSDTEVIVHAYEEWGTDCVTRFNGMFAFCVYDGKRLFLARDRIGEKPLYYARRGRNFYFASEIKALLTQIESAPRIGPDFWFFDGPVEDQTLFEGVFQLRPAHRMTWDGKELKIDRYWELREETGTRAEADYVEELRWLLADAVRLRLISDVPVGLFLSGGLDSAAIACLAKPERVYSCNFPLGEKYDELAYAEIVAKKIKAEMHVVRPTAADFREHFPKVIWHLEQPIATASTIAEYLLAREATKKVKVILGGQGADEVFGGYIRYVLMTVEDRLGTDPAVANYRDLMKFFWRPEMFDDPARRYFELVRRIPGEDGAQLARIRRHFERFTLRINQVGYTDLVLSLPALLTMNDRAAAAFGLENRCPLLDHRIVEFAFRLPPQMKIREFRTKWILRQAVRGVVPDAIIDRVDKKGLVVPFQQWLTADLKAWARALVRSLARRIPLPPDGGRGEFDRGLYTRVSLELWFRNFFPDFGRR